MIYFTLMCILKHWISFRILWFSYARVVAHYDQHFKSIKSKIVCGVYMCVCNDDGDVCVFYTTFSNCNLCFSETCIAIVWAPQSHNIEHAVACAQIHIRARKKCRRKGREREKNWSYSIFWWPLLILFDVLNAFSVKYTHRIFFFVCTNTREKMVMSLLRLCAIISIRQPECLQWMSSGWLSQLDMYQYLWKSR